MDNEKLTLYCDLMMEIRSRAEIISKFEDDKSILLPVFGKIESIILQVRKILELIALSSMVANEEVYRQQYSNFRRHSHAKYILRDIEKLNPDFYPKPTKHSPSHLDGVDHHIAIYDASETDSLSRREFEFLYDKCGSLLHAQNPFGSKRDYRYYLNNIPIWMTRIRNLLNLHVIRLIEDENYYLIQMKSIDGKAYGVVLSSKPVGMQDK